MHFEEDLDFNQKLKVQISFIDDSIDYFETDINEIFEEGSFLVVSIGVSDKQKFDCFPLSNIKKISINYYEKKKKVNRNGQS